MSTPSDSEIIDRLGGNDEVAKLCPPIKKAAISLWRKRGIPHGWRAYLKLLRPGAFRSRA